MSTRNDTPSQSSNSLRAQGKRLWDFISNLLTVQSLWTIFGGGSAATYVASRFQSGALLALFGAITAFAFGGLVTRLAAYVNQAYRYWHRPPQTTVELHGGNTLTLGIHHKGLPAKVRARVRWTEFAGNSEPEGLPVRPEPFDVHLFTRVHGGSYRQVAVDETFDLAKAHLAALSALDGKAKFLSIHLPGLGDAGCVVQAGHTVLIHLDVTVFVTTPLRTVCIERPYRLFVQPEGIRVADDHPVQ